MLCCWKVPELSHPGGSDRGVSNPLLWSQRGSGPWTMSVYNAKGSCVCIQTSDILNQLYKQDCFAFWSASISVMGLGLSWWMGGGSCHGEHYRPPQMYIFFFKILIHLFCGYTCMPGGCAHATAHTWRPHKGSLGGCFMLFTLFESGSLY